MINQPLLVLAHLEKIVGLLNPLRRGVVVRALAVYQLPLGVEPFAAETVKPLVFAEVDVAGLINGGQNPAYHLFVILVGGADKVAVADVQFSPEIPEQGGNDVGIGLGRYAPGRGGFHDLVAVFIGAGEKKDLFAGHGMKTGRHVGHDGGIGVTQMGLCVHIVDRCGDVKTVGHGFSPVRLFFGCLSV